MVKIGNYTLTQRPSRGWSPIERTGRVIQTPTLDGAIITAREGHISDRLQTITFSSLPSSPAQTEKHSHTVGGGAGYVINAGEKRGFLIPLADTSTFMAISSAWLLLRRSADATGTATVDLYDTVTAATPTIPNAPGRRIGCIGTLDIPNDITTEGSAVYVHCDTAYPLEYAYGLMVLDCTGMTAGTVSWLGDGVGAPGHIVWTEAAEWAAANGDLAASVWEGEQFNILRGFAAAYGGGESFQIKLDDGIIYNGIVTSVTGATELYASEVTQFPINMGRVSNVRMQILLTSEVRS